LNIEEKIMKNMLIIIILTGAAVMPLMLSQCVTSVPVKEPASETAAESEPAKTSPPLKSRSSKFEHEAVSVIARKYALSETPGGMVLKAAVEMVDKKVLVIGSCWGYVNKVYENAGFPKEKRMEVYMSDKNGPYADPSLLKPGDWIMYRNLPYREVTHSAIFVEWINVERRSALTIEYVGTKRKIPGRYREADITKLFGILRGME
jgi:hypothetical protein